MAPAILARVLAGGAAAATAAAAPSAHVTGGAGVAKRLLSAQAKPTHLRQYLDAWMGNTGTSRGAAAHPATAAAADARMQQPGTSSSAASAVMQGTPLTVAGKSYLVPTLRLPRGVSPEELRNGIQATTSLSAGYFQSAPIVVDLFEWTQASPRAALAAGGEALDGALLRTFIRALREAGLHPVGIANATATDMQAAALEEGLPCFMGRHTPALAAAAPPPLPAAPATEAATEQPSQRPEPAAGRGRVSSAAYRKRNSVVREAAAKPLPEAQEEQTQQERRGQDAAALAAAMEADAAEEEEEEEDEDEDAAAPPAPQPLPTKVVQGSVRTGQQVFAEGCSLVVLGHVNSGAEVSADGDIHVYGKLTGRALAGLSGDPKARIFAGRFNAELVAIGDVFTTCDQPNDLPGVVVPNAPTSIALDPRRRELIFHSFKV